MTFLKNISWIFSANLFVALTKWLVVVIIARLLTPEDVGAYSLAFAICAPITLFADMKLRSIYVVDNNPEFINYSYIRNTLSAFSFVIILLVALFIYPSYIYIIILVGLNKILDLRSEMYYALPHKKERMDSIGILMIKKHILTFLGFIIILYLFRDLLSALIIQTIIQFLFLVIEEKRKAKGEYLSNNDEYVDIKKIKKILSLGTPIGLASMMISLNLSYPRYLLELMESAEILGYFSAISYILTIGNLLISAISQSFLPSLYKKVEHKEFNSFKKSIFINLNIVSVVLGLFLVIFSYLFGEFFLEFIYGESYAAYNDILILMSIALSLNFISWNFDTALMAMRYTSVEPKINFIILVINFILGYILMEQYGIYGACYTLIIINIIQLILRGWFVNSKFNKLVSDSINQV